MTFFFLCSTMVATASDYVELKDIPQSSATPAQKFSSLRIDSGDAASAPVLLSNVPAAQPETKEQILADLDRELENDHKTATGCNKWQQAMTILEHDRHACCVEVSCCCPWRAWTYTPDFKGLAGKLMCTFAGNDYQKFKKAPKLHEQVSRYRFTWYAPSDITSQDAYQRCMNLMPQDINVPSVHGKYPIHAIVGGRDKARKLNSDSSVNVESEYREALLKEALKRNADVCVPDENGNTALMLAAPRSLPLTQALVAHLKSKQVLGAQLEATNKEGKTALVQVADAVRAGGIANRTGTVWSDEKFARYQWKISGQSGYSVALEDRKIATSRYLLNQGASQTKSDGKGNSFASLSKGNLYLESALALHKEDMRSGSAQPGPIQEQMQD